MNQKNLAIAIIVVAAVAVVLGLWLSGAGQTGPLAGCTDCAVGPQYTTLTLEVWENNEYVSSGPEREIIFRGTLLAGGNPVSDRTVTISTDGMTVATVTTMAGRFEACYAETGGSQPYVATFAGDDQYLPSESGTLSSPVLPLV